MNPASALNEMFTHKVASREGREKVAEEAGSYIRDRLREVAFVRQILPPQKITRAECQVSTDTDTIYKQEQLEPKSRAMSLSFRGSPTTRYIRAPRMNISFFTVSSEMYQKTEQELLAYSMPITKIIEDNSVKDLQEIEDREFLIHTEAAVQALQKEANGGVATALNYTTANAGSVVEFSVRKGELARSAGSNTTAVLPVQRPDIVQLYKMLDGNRLRAETTLLTEVDFDDLLQWTVEDAGNKVQSETLEEGFKYNRLLGRGYIRTIKTDILRPGNMYTFTKPEFFGKFYILNNTKFYIDKIANLISFQCYQDIALGLVNIAAVRKLELYAADANPETQVDLSVLSRFVPVNEEDLGALNNRVEQGLAFPQIVTY